MTYSAKEIFKTLQGEGAHAGRAAVFCRFAGCNLWTGRESDRASAACTFCDTDFIGTDGEGGGKFTTAQALADAIAAAWGPARNGATWSSPAASAAAAGRGPAGRGARARLHGGHRDQRHDARASRHRLDLRQPQGHGACGAGTRQRTQAGLSASQCAARTLRAPGFRAFLPATPDGPARVANTERAVNTVRSIRNGGSACKRINT